MLDSELQEHALYKQIDVVELFGSNKLSIKSFLERETICNEDLLEGRKE